MNHSPTLTNSNASHSKIPCHFLITSQIVSKSTVVEAVWEGVVIQWYKQVTVIIWHEGSLEKLKIYLFLVYRCRTRTWTVIKKNERSGVIAIPNTSDLPSVSDSGWGISRRSGLEFRVTSDEPERTLSEALEIRFFFCKIHSENHSFSCLRVSRLKVLFACFCLRILHQG